MEIKQKFEVNGKTFDTIEAAEAYVADNKDIVRVDAYVEYLRSNGAQRISKTVTETLLDFIKFEKGHTETKDEEDTSTTPWEEEASTEVEESVETETSVVSLVEEEATNVEPEPQSTGGIKLFGQ